jgi:hypothetical protein
MYTPWGDNTAQLQVKQTSKVAPVARSTRSLLAHRIHILNTKGKKKQGWN